VYFVREGLKQWVIDAAWLTANGFRWPEDVMVITADELDQIPREIRFTRGAYGKGGPGGIASSSSAVISSISPGHFIPRAIIQSAVVTHRLRPFSTK
jgi:hypothetical protein